jgi:hypothetical protein
MVLFVATGASTALAQGFSCVANVADRSLRSEGITELASDYVLQCSGIAPAGGIVSNISVFFNTDVTSRLLGGASEALLLIEEPAPTTQVLGVNVFQGTVSGHSVAFSNIPVVNAPGGNVTRVLRITNVRLNASQCIGLRPRFRQCFASISDGFPVPVSNPIQVMNVNSPLAFGAAARCTLAAERIIDLHFAESFPTEFKPRDCVGQSTPGVIYDTKSGFTPDPVIVGVGTADNGTRLSAVFSGVTGTQLSAPATVTNGALTITAISPAGGGPVPIVVGTATIIYEVTAASPNANESISVPVTASSAFSGMTVKGNLASISTVQVASSTEPIPRFADQATAIAVNDACVAVPSMSPYALAGLIPILLGLGAASTRRLSRR